MNRNMKTIRLWDLPTRAFHWLFAIAVLGAIITNLLDEIVWHSYCGYSALVLVIFRIIWGFVGPHHARFSSFVPSITQLKLFLKDQKSATLGHNPLGALSVMAMLLIVLVQASSGLFTDDEISFQGPLAKYVSNNVVEWMTELHEANHLLVYGIVVLHLAAIFYYQKMKKQNILGPMIHGDKAMDASETIPAEQVIESLDDSKTRMLALILVVVLSVLFKYFVIA
jgi:cytochrome b